MEEGGYEDAGNDDEEDGEERVIEIRFIPSDSASCELNKLDQSKFYYFIFYYFIFYYVHHIFHTDSYPNFPQSTSTQTLYYTTNHHSNTTFLASKLHGVNSTIRIFVFASHFIVFFITFFNFVYYIFYHSLLHYIVLFWVSQLLRCFST